MAHKENVPEKMMTKKAQSRNNNVMKGKYTCPELRSHPVRAGCMDAFQKPSRFGDTLVYRDGRKEKMK